MKLQIKRDYDKNRLTLPHIYKFDGTAKTPESIRVARQIKFMYIITPLRGIYVKIQKEITSRHAQEKHPPIAHALKRKSKRKSKARPSHKVVTNTLNIPRRDATFPSNIALELSRLVALRVLFKFLFDLFSTYVYIFSKVYLRFIFCLYYYN